MKNVCVLGAGAWGTSVSTLLAHNGYNVTLWCHEPQVAETINAAHHNERYLPGIDLDRLIVATTVAVAPLIASI